MSKTDDFLHEYSFPLAIIFTMLFFCALLIFFMYQDGAGKAQYLKEKKGVTMPWYRAISLPDSVFIDANINTKMDLKTNDAK